MSCKVDGIGTFILGNSSSWCGIGLPTSLAFFLLSGVVGRFALLASNYWECWPVASRARLAPTKTQNEGKTSDSRRSLLYRSSGGRMVCPIWYEMSSKGGVLPPSGGRAELPDLEFLGSVPFDTNYSKIQWSFKSVLYSAMDCIPTVEPDICSMGLIKILGPPATDPRGNIPRRKQIWQRAAGSQRNSWVLGLFCDTHTDSRLVNFSL